MKFKEGKSALVGVAQSVMVGLEFEHRCNSKSSVLSIIATMELGI